MDSETFSQTVMNFKAALKEMALVHMNAGEDKAAGLLLVLERRVYTSMLHYEMQAPAVAPDFAEDKAPKKRRGRPRKGEAEAAQTEITEP